MTGVNWFFVSLAWHARDGGGELREWLNEAESASYCRSQLWTSLHRAELAPTRTAPTPGPRGTSYSSSAWLTLLEWYGAGVGTSTPFQHA
jgi:hypothetical protein